MDARAWATPRPSRRGHPGLSWTDVEVAGCAAWLADIRGWSRPRIAQHLFPDDLAHYRDDGSLRRKVRRYVGAGRQSLCDQGLWPWNSVPLDPIEDDVGEIDGVLPERWWEDDDVLAHLAVW